MAYTDRVEAPARAGRDQAGGQGLLYHAGGLGDFVLSLPAVARVIQAHPGLAWSYWGRPERLALLPGFAPAPPALLRVGHALWGEGSAPEAVDALSPFGVVLAFGGREAPGWARRLGPRGVGVASFPGAGGAWVPHHQARQLAALGAPRVPSPWLGSWRRRVLPGRAPREILLHPGSGDRRKNLPVGTWRETLARLAEPGSLPTRLLLGPAEAERGGWEPLAAEVDAVTPCQTLADLLGVLAGAALFLGNDGGVTHLAAALGVPTVAAFGPTDPRLWHPLGPRVTILRARRACAPCTAGEPILCEAPACLGEVRAEALAAAARAHLGRGLTPGEVPAEG